MNHPVLSAIAAMHAALDEVAGVDPLYMSVEEKKTALVEMARLQSRAQALDFQLLVAGKVDVADETGARSTAAWLADETRDIPGALRNQAALAERLSKRWTQVADAFAGGSVNLAQTRVIVDALDDLPDELGEPLLAKAETFLLEHAVSMGPRDLRRLGRGVLEHLAPDLADAHDLRQLEAEEAAASASTRLKFRPAADGTFDIHATRVPGHQANRLRAILDAYANPRRPEVAAGSDYYDLPLSRRHGLALGWFLESLDQDALPRHGGTSTALVVTMPLDALASGIGVATTNTGDRMTAGQVRRLACQALIIPGVLGTKSEILDLGRGSRLFRPAQRRIMEIRDKECTTHGCHVPAAFCHAHHFRRPWSKGGKTDIADGKLLCPFHHGRAHDPTWETHHHPDGSTSFTRPQK